MRFSATRNVLLVGLAIGVASVYGCSSGGSNTNPFGNPGTAGTTGPAAGSAGTTTSGASGATGGDTSGAAGTTTAGTGGAPGTAGAGGSTTTVGTGGSTTDGGTTGAGGTDGGGAGGSTTGAGGAGPLGDITKVLPTAGCGMAPTEGAAGQTKMYTIATSGTKPAKCGSAGAVPNNCCADSNCNAWQYNRNYYITLPTGYDNTKAYPLVLEGPGCGGGGADVYPLSYTPPGAAMGANNVNNTVIRVGLTPPPNDIGHATNPGQGCFDDKEGNSSVDWVFYETLYDHLATELCFDRNRLFSAGNSSGAWFSNELGCKYAGDSKRPVRGIMPNTGGLPSQPMYEPICTNAPMAGMWVGETMDPENAFSNNVFAINRAAGVNGCNPGTFTIAELPNDPNFPIGGGNADSVCKQVMGCPALYPLVVCLIPGNQHASHDSVTNPGFGTFISMFEKAPFLTP